MCKFDESDACIIVEKHRSHGKDHNIKARKAAHMHQLKEY